VHTHTHTHTHTHKKCDTNTHFKLHAACAGRTFAPGTPVGVLWHHAPSTPRAHHWGKAHESECMCLCSSLWYGPRVCVYVLVLCSLRALLPLCSASSVLYSLCALLPLYVCVCAPSVFCSLCALLPLCSAPSVCMCLCSLRVLLPPSVCVCAHHWVRPTRAFLRVYVFVLITQARHTCVSLLEYVCLWYWAYKSLDCKVLHHKREHCHELC